MRHDRHCFGRLEQEDQRLKKHYGRWMDIVRSLELESCILTKLTKPFVLEICPRGNNKRIIIIFPCS